MAEAERRLRTRQSFLSSLTPEQIEAVKAYRGPEILGRGGPKLDVSDPAA